MTRERMLASTMIELADTLVEDFDIVDLLTTLVDRCVEVLDIVAAGILLVDTDDELRAMASSSETMRVVELFELQAREGPCLDCYRTGQPVVNQDLVAAVERWPSFAPVAVDAGFRAADAVPLRLRGDVLGALNLFRAAPSSLNVDDLAAAQALADIATIALMQHSAAREARRLSDQLSEALTSRIVIEQAKGMVADREGLDMQQAFARLRAHARNHNARLSDVAAGVIAGTLRPSDLDRPPR